MFSDFGAELPSSLQAGCILKFEGVEPTYNRECEGTLNECFEDAPADPKGIEFPEKILPLITYSEEFLGVGGELKWPVQRC